MEKLLNSQMVSLCRTYNRGEEECPINGDFVLPEYCPDMAVILKCQVTPRILSRQYSGGRLTVDGMNEIRILYLDEERRCLRQVEFTLPLSCTVEMPEEEGPVYLRTKFRPKYVNCRPLSPRRLEVRGALVLIIQMEKSVAAEFACLPTDESVYTRQQTVEVSTMGACSEKILAVNDTVDFPTDRPADALLGGDCRGVIKECKLLAGKAIVKGDVYFHQLYTDDAVDGQVYSLDFTLPFSQILDVEGAGEGIPYRADVSVVSDTQRCSEGQQGEGRVLEVAAKLLVQLQLYASQAVTVMTDAYHAHYPTVVDTAEQSLCARLGCRFENVSVPMSLELPAQPLEGIVDVWVCSLPASVVCADGMALVQGKLQVCMVVRDSDGMLSYFERAEDYRLEYPCQGNKAEATVEVVDWHYRTAGGKLELQAVLAVCLEPMNQYTLPLVTQLTLDTDNPYPPERATLKLYYGEQGESVWDIGRQCHASVDRIVSENAVNGEVLTHDTLLLVPIAD